MATVLVTGISGNLGTRLLPMLSEFRVVGVDLRPPESLQSFEFHAMNLGHESSCRELTQLLRHTGVKHGHSGRPVSGPLHHGPGHDPTICSRPDISPVTANPGYAPRFHAGGSIFWMTRTIS